MKREARVADLLIYLFGWAMAGAFVLPAALFLTLSFLSLSPVMGPIMESWRLGARLEFVCSTYLGCHFDAGTITLLIMGIVSLGAAAGFSYGLRVHAIRQRPPQSERGSDREDRAPST